MNPFKSILFFLFLVSFSACTKKAPNAPEQISGDYLHDFKRWNAQDSTSVSLDSALCYFGQPANFIYDDSTNNPNIVETASGYYIQPRYVLYFSNNAGVLSNFFVQLNADDIATMAAAGVNIADGPNILIADPIAEIFEFQYTLKLGDPFEPTSYSYTVDKYYRQ